MKRTLIKLPIIPEESKQTHTNKQKQPKIWAWGFWRDLSHSVIQIKIAVDLILFSYLLFKSPSFRRLKNTFIEML